MVEKLKFDKEWLVENTEHWVCPFCDLYAKPAAVSKEDGKTKICLQCYIEEENVLFFLHSIRNRFKENKRKWVAHAVRY